ncbi:FAD-binding domain-containing protein, partial [Aureobasidium melanogenum]
MRNQVIPNASNSTSVRFTDRGSRRIFDLAPKASLSGASACIQLITTLGAAKIRGPHTVPYVSSQEDYWNAKQSSYDPSCVVYPKSAQDVSTTLKIIKTAGSRFAIKAGGHNPNTFFSSVESGVLIDLNSMTQKSYDSNTTLGTYQPGGTFGDIYDYFQQFGRTVVGARLAGVGTGLALGGGLSYLSGQYGLACDSFRELEVVLPNGTIVTASPTENEDLFFADRGGGGNAYGVVTKYTVQTRPSGTFYAGNLIYLFKQTANVLEAIQNFMKYNTDPKAAIIGTYEKLFTPAVGNLNLDEAVIMFLVYDGPDPGDAFANFTALPHLVNTLGPKTYPEVVNMPIPMSTELSRGDNIFRVQVHRLDDDSYQKAFEAWESWCAPVPKSLTDASNSQNGGNAMQMPDGPWFWLNFLLSTPPGISKTAYDRIQQSFRDMVNSVPNAEGLPLFINDASFDQNPLQTFSTYSRLQDIKRKYDPDGFFETYTGGWSFS